MKIGIAGIGAIGLNVALSLDRQEIPGFQLAGFSARSKDRAAQFNDMLSLPIKHYGFAELAQNCDIIIECLPPQLFKKIAIPVLKAGKILIALSASQLLKYDDLIDLAEEYGGQIIVPSGAMLGLDALKAVMVGELQSVKIETRKPIAGLINSPYFIKKGIDPATIDEPKLILSGSVSTIAKEFPANVNVAAALSLAGLGADRTICTRFTLFQIVPISLCQFRTVHPMKIPQPERSLHRALLPYSATCQLHSKWELNGIFF